MSNSYLQLLSLKFKACWPSLRSYWLLGLIVALGLFFRWYQLGSVPVSTYWDETAMLVDAKSVAQSGLDMHGRPWFQLLYPSYGDYKLPVYIWLASLSVKLFGVSHFALRLPSALAGIGTLIVVAWLASQITTTISSAKDSARRTKLGVLASLAVLSTSPWAILFSRTGFEGHVGQFWLSLSVAMAFASRRKPWLVVLSAVLGSLSTYTYFSVRFVWPVVFTLTILLFGNWPSYKKMGATLTYAVKQLVLPLALFGLLLIPMTKSPLYSDSNRFRLSTTSVLNSHDYPIISNQMRDMAGNNRFDRFLFHRDLLMMRELADNYSDHVSLRTLFIDGDSNLRHGTGQHGLFLFLFLPFFIIGWLFLTQQNWKIAGWLAVWWLVALLPASVPETTPHALRSLNALVPLTLVIGFGLVCSYEFMRDQTPKRWFHTSLFLFVTFFCLSFLQFGQYYFVVYPKVSSIEWQDGYPQIAAIINDRSEQVSDVWVSSSEELSYLWLMAFGKHTSQDFHLWQSVGFKFKQIDNIKFKNFSWEEYRENPTKSLVIEQFGSIEKRLDEYEIVPEDLIYIKSEDGVTRFTAVILSDTPNQVVTTSP